jgi:regulatory protein
MRRLGRSRPSSEDARNPDRIRAAAIVHLSRRDFASGELHKKLTHQGYVESLVTDLIDELTAEGVLNDPRYAENFVAYHANRGEGPLRIQAELREFGLTDALIQPALDAISDWKTRASGVRARRFGAEPPETWTEKAKQARFLQYRGFSSDHIRAALGPDFELDSD